MRAVNLVIFLTLLGYAYACPKATYSYQVLELSEPTLIALGQYIVKIMKKERDIDLETCSDHNSKYLDAYLDAPKQFDAVTMAGIFMHQYINAPNEIFYGVEATETALGSDCTFNILISKDLPLRKFLLKNETDGDIFIAYLTEDALMEKMVHLEAWRNIDVIKCEHYLYHLSSAYGKQNVTYTVIDKEESNEQMDLSMITVVAGFYKKGCVVDSQPDKAKKD